MNSNLKTKAEQAADRFAAYEATQGRSLSPQQRIVYVDGYLQAALEKREASKPHGENYAPPKPTEDADDERLYLDEDKWAAHMRGFHGKPLPTPPGDSPSKTDEPELVLH